MTLLCDVIFVQRFLVIFLKSEIVTLKLQAQFFWHFTQVFISKVANFWRHFENTDNLLIGLVFAIARKLF